LFSLSYNVALERYILYNHTHLFIKLFQLACDCLIKSNQPTYLNNMDTHSDRHICDTTVSWQGQGYVSNIHLYHIPLYPLLSTSTPLDSDVPKDRRLDKPPNTFRSLPRIVCRKLYNLIFVHTLHSDTRELIIMCTVNSSKHEVFKQQNWHNKQIHDIILELTTDESYSSRNLQCYIKYLQGDIFSQ